MSILEKRKTPMKRIYTWTAQPATRSVTIAGMQAAKGTQKWTQVTANTTDEAAAAEAAGIDMMIGRVDNVKAVREGSKTLFLTAAIGAPDFATTDDILKRAWQALADGADAIMTARSMKVVNALAEEDIPVMGHLGLVPRKSTWTDGLRAVGKTADEAFELFRKFKRLEDAGGVMVEAEIIPGSVMAEISKRTKVICVSLGSGGGADVDYLFMNDICGEQEYLPRHSRAFGNLHRLYEQIKAERIAAVTAFRDATQSGTFPAEAETPQINDREMEAFLNKLERYQP
jgi:3-methyl-2-oxobutanoate hydroxymethyltransferase